MRLVSFSLATRGGHAPESKGASASASGSDHGHRFVGVELPVERVVVNLNVALNDPNLTMRTLLQRGQQGLSAAAAAVKSGKHRLRLDQVRIRAPINDPEKILCVGMNYKDHCIEQNLPVPEEPVLFSKFASAIADPDGDVYCDETEELDFEVELAIVIGKRCKHVRKEEAMSYVAGFTVGHDVSARDWQLKRNGKQWMLGKTFDTYAPIGPAIVTTDEIGDPHALNIKCLVNGKVMQNSNTDQMVHRTEDIIAWVTRFMTLVPGDIILTGTPPGVGVFRKPPVFLKEGDVVRCEIEKIGAISNKVAREPRQHHRSRL